MLYIAHHDTLQGKLFTVCSVELNTTAQGRASRQRKLPTMCVPSSANLRAMTLTEQEYEKLPPSERHNWYQTSRGELTARGWCASSISEQLPAAAPRRPEGCRRWVLLPQASISRCNTNAIHPSLIAGAVMMLMVPGAILMGMSQFIASGTKSFTDSFFDDVRNIQLQISMGLFIAGIVALCLGESKGGAHVGLSPLHHLAPACHLPCSLPGS